MFNVSVTDPSVESLPRTEPVEAADQDRQWSPASALAHLEQGQREEYEHVLAQFGAQQEIGLRN